MENSFEQIKSQTFDNIIEIARDDYHETPLHPFKAYANQLKMGMEEAFNHYIRQVRNGYDEIIKQLDSKITE